MSTLIRALRDLHRSPRDWSCRQYARHTRRITLRIWMVMVASCVILGLAIGRPVKPFDEFQPFTIYTVFAMAVCSIVCGQCARLTAAGARRLWLLMSLGFAFLAADDLLSIHERLDIYTHRAFGADAQDPITDHLDDLIVVLYGVMGLVVLYRQREHVRQIRGFVRGLLYAGGCFVVMVVFDAVGGFLPTIPAGLAKIIEESFKALAISWFFWTFAVARFQLRRPQECA